MRTDGARERRAKTQHGQGLIMDQGGSHSLLRIKKIIYQEWLPSEPTSTAGQAVKPDRLRGPFRASHAPVLPCIKRPRNVPRPFPLPKPTRLQLESARPWSAGPAEGNTQDRDGPAHA